MKRHEKLRKVWEETYNVIGSCGNISIREKLSPVELRSIIYVKTHVEKCKTILELAKIKDIIMQEGLEDDDDYFFYSSLEDLKTFGVIKITRSINVIEEYLKELEKQLEYLMEEVA